MTVSIRAVSVHDVGSLVDLLQADRLFQQPWHRTRGEDYFTAAYQRREIVEQVGEYADGVALPYVILDGGDVVGRIMVSNVVRGAFHSGDLGYWVTESRNGRGVATAAVAAMVTVAFDEMQLHRLQASTLHRNHGSQRVLTRNGFDCIGSAARYLRIDGRWQDHLLFQRINDSVEQRV